MGWRGRGRALATCMPTFTLDMRVGVRCSGGTREPSDQGEDGSGRCGQPQLQLRNRRQRLAPQLQGSLLLASSMGNL